MRSRPGPAVASRPAAPWFPPRHVADVVRLIPVLTRHATTARHRPARIHPGARPTEVDAYRYEELSADAFAFGRELGERFHLSPNDWARTSGGSCSRRIPHPAPPSPPSRYPSLPGLGALGLRDQKWRPTSPTHIWMTEGDGEALWTPERMRNM
jgi:hypothetical protein